MSAVVSHCSRSTFNARAGSKRHMHVRLTSGILWTSESADTAEDAEAVECFETMRPPVLRPASAESVLQVSWAPLWADRLHGMHAESRVSLRLSRCLTLDFGTRIRSCGRGIELPCALLGAALALPVPPVATVAAARLPFCRGDKASREDWKELRRIVGAAVQELSERGAEGVGAA